MKTYLFILALLSSGLIVKAQSSTPSAATETQAADQGTDTSSGFASRGCVELGGSISLNSQSAGINQFSTEFLFSPFIGWFPVKGFELGVDPFSLSASNGSVSLLVLLAPAYNFQIGSNMFPFIEGDIGINYYGFSGNSESGLSVGARGGLKIEIVKHAILNVFVQYFNNSQGSDGESSGNLIIGSGFTVAW